MKNVVAVVFVVASLTSSAFADMKKLPAELNHSLITGVEHQTDVWSSAFNAGARVIHALTGYLGKDKEHPVDYGTFKTNGPKSVDGERHYSENVGPLPSALVSYLNQQSTHVQFEEKTAENFDALLVSFQSLIDQGLPVIIFEKVGEYPLESKLDPKSIAEITNLGPKDALEVKIPLVDYVILNGYDAATHEYSYIDTHSEEKTISHDNLKTALDWSLGIPPQIKDVLTFLFKVYAKELHELGLNDLHGILNLRGNTYIVPHLVSEAKSLPIHISAPIVKKPVSPAEHGKFKLPVVKPLPPKKPTIWSRIQTQLDGAYYRAAWVAGRVSTEIEDGAKRAGWVYRQITAPIRKVGNRIVEESKAAYHRIELAGGFLKGIYNWMTGSSKK